MMMTSYLIFEIVEPFLCLAFLIFQLLQCGSQGVQFALFGINWRRLASDKFCNIFQLLLPEGFASRHSLFARRPLSGRLPARASDALWPALRSLWKSFQVPDCCMLVLVPRRRYKRRYQIALICLRRIDSQLRYFDKFAIFNYVPIKQVIP